MTIVPRAFGRNLPTGEATYHLEDLLAAPGGAPTAAGAFPLTYGRLMLAAMRPVLLLPPIPDGLGAVAAYSEWVERARVRLDRAGVPTVTSYGYVESARAAAYPGAELAWLAGGVGSACPRFIFVGERHPAGGPAFGTRSGRWLLGAVAHIGIDDLACYLGNAYGPTAAPGANKPLRRFIEFAATEARRLARPEPRVIALGGEAAAFLKLEGIPFVRAPHPAWHERFHGTEGPAGFAARLRDAGFAPDPDLVWHAADPAAVAPLPEPVARIHQMACAAGAKERS